VIAVVVLGLVLTVLSASLLESVAGRRRETLARVAARHNHDGGAPPPPPEPEGELSTLGFGRWSPSGEPDRGDASLRTETISTAALLEAARLTGADLDPLAVPSSPRSPAHPAAGPRDGGAQGGEVAGVGAGDRSGSDSRDAGPAEHNGWDRHRDERVDERSHHDREDVAVTGRQSRPADDDRPAALLEWLASRSAVQLEAPPDSTRPINLEDIRKHTASTSGEQGDPDPDRVLDDGTAHGSHEGSGERVRRDGAE